MSQPRVYKEALVLAGGIGSRLSSITGEVPKYLLDIRGLPLAFYPILILRIVGVERFVIVVAEKYADLMKRRFSRLVKHGGPELVYVYNPKPELENGYSLLLGVREIKSEEFIVTVGDHLYGTNLIKSIMSYQLREADVRVGGDADPKYVNVEEATRILADKNGRLLNIGKNLSEFTHIDVGVFLFKKKALESFINAGIRSKITISGLILEMLRRGVNVHVAEVKGAAWCDVDTPEDLRDVLEGSKTIILDLIHSEVSKYLEEQEQSQRG